MGMCRDLKALHLELRKRISLFRILSLARSMALDLIQRFDSFFGFSHVGFVGLLLCYCRLVGCVFLIIIIIKVCVFYSSFQFLWFISLCLHSHYLIPPCHLKITFTSNPCIFSRCMNLIFWFWSRGENSFEGDDRFCEIEFPLFDSWGSWMKISKFFNDLPLILSLLLRKRKPNTNVQF